MSHAEAATLDPAIAEDPMPPGKLGMWFFLASEVMFFAGLLAAYVVLRAGDPELFRKHALALNGWLTGINTLLLMLSSCSIFLASKAAGRQLRQRTVLWLSVTLLLGIGFLVIKAREYKLKFDHHTIVTIENGQTYVYDGIATRMDGAVVKEINGFRAKPPANFDIYRIAEQDVRRLAATDQKLESPAGLTAQRLAVTGTLSQDISYGPWKNIFLACYFTLTGVHAAHILGGAVALSFILAHAIRGRVLAAHTEYLALYWYFVDVVWLLLFPILYLF